MNPLSQKRTSVDEPLLPPVQNKAVDLSVRSSGGIELIQQWQAYGPLPPELLDEASFKQCKEMGITSLQSYVYWAEIEKRPGEIDFGTYDILVERLQRHGLKWVPFFIVGPYYATPLWFQKSTRSVYAKCLEHGLEAPIQSIWNPYLPEEVGRLLEKLAHHYGDDSVLESVALGISGNWGEALYPATGGFLHPPGGFHTHVGWWCGDQYAAKAFRRFALERYGSLDEINQAWGTDFLSVEEIDFPRIRNLESFSSWEGKGMRRWLGDLWEIGPMAVWRYLTLRLDRRFGYFREVGFVPWLPRKASGQEICRWLDFVYWCLRAMTDWAEFWLLTARRCFLEAELYLVTGGNGSPVLGADFVSQVKAARKYDAGIRVTNQNDDYGHSFALTRLVSVACRFYDTYFTTEEGGVNSPDGITMRVFDAATSGAKGLYFKSLMGVDLGPCGSLPHLGQPTQGARNLLANLHHLRGSQPRVEVAILFPNTSISIDPDILRRVYASAVSLRDYLDVDLVDEQMIVDGALAQYRFLVIFEGRIYPTEVGEKIAAWVERGGVVIAERKAFGQLGQALGVEFSGIGSWGQGYILPLSVGAIRKTGPVAEAIFNARSRYPWKGCEQVDGLADGVYATLLSDRILFFNSTARLVVRVIPTSQDVEREKSMQVTVPARSIAAVELTP